MACFIEYFPGGSLASHSCQMNPGIHYFFKYSQPFVVASGFCLIFMYSPFNVCMICSRFRAPSQEPVLMTIVCDISSCFIHVAILRFSSGINDAERIELLQWALNYYSISVSVNIWAIGILHEDNHISTHL